MNGTSLLSPTSLTGSLRLYVIALLIVGAALPARAQVPQLPTGEEIAAPTMPMREVHLLQAVYAALQANDLAEAGKQMANAIGDEAPTAEARALQTRIRFLEARRALRERGGAGNRYTWESYLERFTQLAPELEKAAREGADDAQTQYLVGATATDHVDLAQERLSNMSQMRYAEEKGPLEAQIRKYMPLGYDALKKCLSLQPDHLDALCHLGGSLVRYGVPRGAELLFVALESEPHRTGALRDLLENVVAAGILDNAEQVAQLRRCVAAQGAAAQQMLRAAVAKHDADRDGAADALRQMAALGFNSPMIEANYRNIMRARTFCQGLLAELEQQ